MSFFAMPTEQQAANPVLSDDEPEYVPTKRAAELLGVTEGRVKHLLHQQRLAGYKPEGERGWQIETASIRRYAAYRQARESAKDLLREDASE
jgi:excisionase family DNA binding protein